MKRVIVTGASGFIGRQVVKCLSKDEYDIHCITTRKIEEALKINNKVRWHRVNLNEHREVEKLFNDVKPQLLIHLAWNVKERNYKNSEDNLNWIGITLNILMEFSKNGGKRAVFAGTCFEYDLTQQELEENCAVVRGINLYGVCKASLNRIVEKYCEETEISYAWARIFYCFGPHENKNRIIPYVISSLIKNKKVTVSNDDQYLDYLSVEEVGNAFYEILISDLTGEVNIGSGNGVNLKDMLKAIGAVLGKKQLIYFTDEISVQYPIVVANNEKILKYTNWSFEKDINVKLEKNIDWWKEQIENER